MQDAAAPPKEGLLVLSPTTGGSTLKRHVAYVFDDVLAEAMNRIPNIATRAFMVHRLIQAYKLLPKMTCLKPRLATTDEILSFHSRTYLDFLATTTTTGDNEQDVHTNSVDEFGIGYDCPIFNNIEMFMQQVGGGTLTAVDALLSGKYQVAINWCGGWHHAQRDEASGFCYVNDVVIGIQRMQISFKKILYVDLDAHHGDGVENAFGFSDKVMTLSLHNYEVGFFPGTGGSSSVGFGKGKYHTVNVPLKSGITDEVYVKAFLEIFETAMDAFPAEAIVVQCGADCIAGDKLGSFNLTEIGLGRCVLQVLHVNLPTLILGGGGYNLANTAKCWTYLTALICGQTISEDIPEHIYFSEYGPDFDLRVTPTLRKNENTLESLDEVISGVKYNLSRLL